MSPSQRVGGVASQRNVFEEASLMFERSTFPFLWLCPPEGYLCLDDGTCTSALLLTYTVYRHTR